MIDKNKLDEIFNKLEPDAVVAILLHPSPDPDCMGAAAGLAVLLKEAYKLNSKLFHFGEISHPQNKSMKNVLRITLSDGNDFNPDDVGAIAVVDTDLIGTGFKSDKLEKVDFRIDHHAMDRNNGAGYADVRPVGSSSAIVSTPGASAEG